MDKEIFLSKIAVGVAFGGLIGLAIAYGAPYVRNYLTLVQPPASVVITNIYYGTQPTTPPKPQATQSPSETFRCKVNDPCPPSMENGTECSQGREWLTCQNGRWVSKSASPRVERGPTPGCKTGKWCDNRGDPDNYCVSSTKQRLLCCFHTLMPAPASGHCPVRM